MLSIRKTWIAPLACAVLLAGCGDGADGANAADPAPQDEQLTDATNRSAITLRGTVASTTPTSFVLDYGADTVTVEMDDWDFYREATALKVGDAVVVTGRVDRDLWERKTIEAESVFVKNLNTYFYASNTDEEDVPVSTIVVDVADYADSTGYVTVVEGEEFTIGSTTGAVRVDTSQLGANKPRVTVGDRVYAWGELDIDPREQLELMAEGVVLLQRDEVGTG